MITDNPTRKRYELSQDGKVAAHIVYRMHGADTIELVHTEVEPAFEGQGFGSRIAKFALDDARTRGLKVIPSCSYIAGWIGKHAGYEDLVAKR
ncbi:GNAT family N-acetyltransferase [Ramlibacter sp. PS4R-6]|uniref:GNAT family N-acetyltransferase n=1 Tax=Ramlibacter sp. PS4R-6 TaxID=3133438 RepID=UPI0030AF93C4